MRSFLPSIAVVLIGCLFSIGAEPVVWPDLGHPKGERIEYVCINPAEQCEVAPEPREAPEFGLLPGETIDAVMTAAQMAEVTDWGHRNLNVPEAWKVTKGKGARVGVSDTGWATNHRDLKSKVVASRSFVPGETVEDRNAHGTHCAAVVAAAQDGWGMTGVAPEAELVIAKSLSNAGSGSVVGIRDSILWMVEQKCQVISLSLGGPSRDPFLPPAIKTANDAGTIVIAAAGNSGPGSNTVGFPGGYPGVICVAATDRNNVVAVFSSRGERVDIAAPGVRVLSAIPGPGDGLFGEMSGTSMATPYIAGLAALWVSVNEGVPPKERQDRFFEALKASATDLPPTGRDTATGHGIPDAYKLVTYKQTPPKKPEPKPEDPKNPDPKPEPKPVDKVLFSDAEIEIILRLKPKK